MSEYATKYASEIRRISQETAGYIHCAVTNAKKCENFCEKFFCWRKSPNGLFQLAICSENQFQDQKDCYYVPVIDFTWEFLLQATNKL